MTLSNYSIFLYFFSFSLFFSFSFLFLFFFIFSLFFLFFFFREAVFYLVLLRGFTQNLLKFYFINTKIKKVHRKVHRKVYRKVYRAGNNFNSV